MKKFSKVLSLLLVFAMIVPGIAQAATVDAEEAAVVTRISGGNRYQTAANVSNQKFGKSKTVVLASGENWPDALAGTALAGVEGAPILLTAARRLHPDTKAELISLGAEKVIIVGGETVIPAAVEDELKAMGLTVDRKEGLKREDTAVAAAKGMTSKTAIIANGYESFADALSAGAYAGMNGMPILFVRQNSVPAGTLEGLKALGIENVIIAGGTSAVSAKVQSELAAYNPTRIYGEIREETSLAFAEKFENNKEVIIANGYDYADALAGAALGAKIGAPVVLVNTNSVKTVVKGFIKENADKNFTVIGGTSAVSNNVMSDIKEIIAPVEEDELKVVSVSAINAAQIKVEFNQKVDKTTAEDLDNYYVGLTKDVSNNSIKDLNGTGYVAKLQLDGKTVIISGADISSDVIWVDENTDSSATALKTNQTGTETVLENRTVYIQMKDIRTADGKLQSAMESSFLAKDSEGPKFAGTNYTVTKVNEDPVITFNEPVEFKGLTNPAQFYLNGTNVTANVDYVAGTPATAADFSTIKVDISASGADMELDEKDNTFEVVGIQDLSGNTTSPNRITTKIKVEEASVVAPKVVGIEQTYDSAFRVIFDRAIDEAGTITIKNLLGDNQDKVFDIKNSGGTKGTDAVKDATYLDPANPKHVAYDVQFDDVTSSNGVYGNATSIIRTIVAEDYKNGSKVGTKYTKAHSFKKDNVAPTIVDAKVASNFKDILFEFEDMPFDGDVVAGIAGTDVSKPIILKVVEDGITRTVAVETGTTNPLTRVGGTNKFTLTLDSTETTGVTVNGVTYESESVLFTNEKLKDGIVVTLPYGIVKDDKADTTPQYDGEFLFIGATVDVKGGSTAVVPQTSQADVTYDSTLNIIGVEFHGEDIDANTVVNKANYTFDGKALPKGATIEYGADKIARIKLPANSVVRNGNYTLTIKNVATKSGARMLPTTVTVYDVKDNTQPQMTSAKVTANNTVEVTFDETLGALGAHPARNFKVVINGVELSVSSVTPKSASNRTLVLRTTDTFDYTKSVQVKLANDASGDMFIEDVAGNKAAAKTVTATKDIQ